MLDFNGYTSCLQSNPTSHARFICHCFEKHEFPLIRSYALIYVQSYLCGLHILNATRLETCRREFRVAASSGVCSQAVLCLGAPILAK